MITENTVLILGAGASKPYGYPTGLELIEDLWRMMLDATQTYSQEFGHQQVVTRSLLEGGYTVEQMRDFGTLLRDENPPSIDAFLERRECELTRRIGKAAIAARLMVCSPLSTIDDNWLEHLWHRIYESKTRYLNNKLSIITFNYDQSVEFYLSQRLHAAYGGACSQDELNKLRAVVKVVHVHGAVPMANPGSRALPEHLRQAERDLRIMHGTEADGEPEFEEAKGLISQAKRVCFLGFSFGEENVRRLGVLEGRGGVWEGKRVFASTYKLTDSEARNARYRVFGSQPGFGAGAQNWNCLALIRESGVFERLCARYERFENVRPGCCCPDEGF